MMLVNGCVANSSANKSLCVVIGQVLERCNHITVHDINQSSVTKTWGSLQQVGHTSSRLEVTGQDQIGTWYLAMIGCQGISY